MTDPDLGGPSGAAEIRVDSAAAARFLADRYRGEATLVDTLPQGEWSSAYAFTHDGKELVIRFNPARDTFDLDQVALRFASVAIPVPRVIEVGETRGGFYAVSERAFGSFLEELPREGFERTMPALFDTLEAMKKADTATSAGFGPLDSQGNGRYTGWHDYLVDVENEVPDLWREDWRERLALSPSAASAFRDGLQELLEVVGRCPQPRHLVHSDLLHRNVLVAADRITALLDWQCAMYGDFLYDLAWFTFWAPWHGWDGVEFRGRAFERWGDHGVGRREFEERMRCYEIHIGLRHLVYNAWRDDHVNLEATAARTAEVLRQRME